MCTPAQCKPEAGTLIDRLTRVESAEDFFTILDLPFDPKVVSVYRLHILKAVHDQLDMNALRALDEASATTACRYALQKAYDAFASGGGAKTFKVFQQNKVGFVPLTAIKPAQ